MGNHAGRTRNGRSKPLLTIVSAAVLAVTLLVNVVAPLRSQSPEGQAQAAQAPTPQWQIDAGAKMAFDVASVKQNKSGPPPSGDKPYSNFVLGPGDAYVPNGGLFSAINQPLLIYVAFAYKITNNELPFLMSQLPKWTTLTDRFDIQARVGGNPTKDQMRLMMQSLLADRFKLAIHTETRATSRIRACPGEDREDRAATPTASGRFIVLRDTLTNTSPRLGTVATGNSCRSVPGYLRWFVNLHPCPSGHSCLGARNVTLELIANTFSGPGFANLDRPVLDQTGLTGKFDFTIEFTPQLNGPLPPGADAQPDPSGPTFLEALKEQLGLKLEPQTGPVDVLVVDHVEQPSPN